MGIVDGGRASRPETTLRATTRDDGRLALLSPGVGLWRHVPRPGAFVVPGQDVGELEVLGVSTVLRAPATTAGLVVEVLGAADGRARRPVQHGDVLLVLDAAGMAAAGAPGAGVARRADASMPTAAEGLLTLRAPSSGRYYATPGPGKEPFVRVGDVIATGHTVALLEVMKTFNRVLYGGEGMPERARVRAIVPTPESDLAAGDVILELEPT